jgi:hypothetical protein
MPLSDWPPAWDNKIKRYLQLDGGDEAEKRSKALWQEALQLAGPCRWQQVTSIEEFLETFKPHAQASQAVGRLLEGCQKVALMAVSLGPQVEERSRDALAQQEVFAGFMLDRMGSYLAEWCISRLDRQVSESLGAQGLHPTRRYSPGYQDFSLEAQKVFVDLAADHIPGFRLTSGNMLLPQKSITAIKGAWLNP